MGSSSLGLFFLLLSFSPHPETKVTTNTNKTSQFSHFIFHVGKPGRLSLIYQVFSGTQYTLLENYWNCCQKCCQMANNSFLITCLDISDIFIFDFSKISKCRQDSRRPLIQIKEQQQRKVRADVGSLKFNKLRSWEEHYDHKINTSNFPSSLSSWVL